MSENKEQELTHKFKPNRLDPEEVVGTPAVRHVGKTLESDPEYNELPQRADAPEFQTSSAGGTDLSATPSMSAGSDPLEGAGRITGAGTDQRTEPLKTRLAGDTSSDPHTDVGPDNATTVQHRGEES